MSSQFGKIKLIENAAASGAGKEWPGGKGVFSASGSFGGTTVKLQWSPDDGNNYQDVDRSGDTYVTLTAAGAGMFELPPCYIKGVISGGTPAGINAFAQAVGF